MPKATQLAPRRAMWRSDLALRGSKACLLPSRFMDALTGPGAKLQSHLIGVRSHPTTIGFCCQILGSECLSSFLSTFILDSGCTCANLLPGNIV